MFKKYFNKVLLYNLIIAVVIIVVLLVLMQAGLKSYTRHGQSIAVPDLRGKSLEQAIEVLKQKKLEWAVMDSIFDTDKPPMTVIEQNPQFSSKVKEYRTIYVTINATQAPVIEVPDLIGRSSLKYAKMQLESYGFKMGEMIYKPDPHLNAVIGLMSGGKNISHKTRLPRGTVIDIVLGDGLGSGKISIPYLIGLRLDEAIFKLRGYSLSTGAIVADAGVTDTAGAFIYKQIPAYGAGKFMYLGEPIDLFVAKELPADITVEPELYDLMDSLPAQ